MLSKAFAVKFAVATSSAVVVASACAHPPTDPNAAPHEHDYAETLIVSLDEVRRITKFDGLEPYAYADRHRPLPGSFNGPGPCGAVGSSDVTFTSGWMEYRAVAYSGTTDDLRPGGIAPINEVTQAVAVYHDAGSARDALNQLESTLKQCASFHDTSHDFTMTKPDATSLHLDASRWSHAYRVKNTVLASVGVDGIEPTDQVAANILHKIMDRVQ